MSHWTCPLQTAASLQEEFGKVDLVSRFVLPDIVCHWMCPLQTAAFLQEEFGKAGLVSRIVLPETKTLALVQFHKPGEARHAFKTLAFRRFQSVPLFLEWAPKDIMSPDGLAPQAATKVLFAITPDRSTGCPPSTFSCTERLHIQVKP